VYRDQVVTRSFTPSTNRSTASTPCFAAVAPCCITVVATRLMRVTGDCFRAERVPLRFAADFLVALDRVPALLALFRFAPAVDFAVVFLAAEDDRFDALVVLRRTPLRDDFDAVAMIDSSRKVRTLTAQESGTAMGRRILPARTMSPLFLAARALTWATGSQNRHLMADCNRRSPGARPDGGRQLRGFSASASHEQSTRSGRLGAVDNA
jgi:hypothetical protein